MLVRLLLSVFLVFYFSPSYAFDFSRKSNRDEFITELLPIILELKKQIPNSKNIPNSLIIAQAGLESSFGKRYPPGNLFGLMGKNQRPLRFPSVEEGTKYYLNNLLSHRAYEDFQEEIFSGETNPFVLVKSLRAYSNNPTEYAKKITFIIKSNNLLEFDNKSEEGAF